ncbi:MAG: CbiX/SirB N-terminal domain-containing protein [Deltaproteobacteria bacterium]|nr:CbiX/SirB N-terminal domain-containing protein [Deltaproteobacteria bacterium]
MGPATAVILLGHGSRRAEANQGLHDAARDLRAVLGGAWVEVAFLQLAAPTLADAVADCVHAGADRIVVEPFFLYAGAHVLDDIPRALEALRRDYTHVELLQAPPLGIHPKLAEIAAERLKEVLS